MIRHLERMPEDRILKLLCQYKPEGWRCDIREKYWKYWKGSLNSCKWGRESIQSVMLIMKTI